VRSDERLGWLLVDETDSGEFAVDDAPELRIVSASNGLGRRRRLRARAPVGRYHVTSPTEPENG